MFGFLDSIFPGAQGAQPQGGGMMGILDDPRRASLLGIAASLLQAGGRSTQPMGIGQALGGGLQNAAQLARVAQQGQLQQMQAKKLQADMAEAERRRAQWHRAFPGTGGGIGDATAMSPAVLPQLDLDGGGDGGVSGRGVPSQLANLLSIAGPEKGLPILAQHYTKESSPTEIEKLFAVRDRLPVGHADRGTVEAKIKRLSEPGPRNDPAQVAVVRAMGLDPAAGQGRELLQGWLSRADRGGGDYAPTQIEKLMTARDRLPAGHADRHVIEAQIRRLSESGEMTPAQSERMRLQGQRDLVNRTVQAERRFRTEMEKSLKQMQFDSPDNQNAYLENLRREIYRGFQVPLDEDAPPATQQTMMPAAAVVPPVAQPQAQMPGRTPPPTEPQPQPGQAQPRPVAPGSGVLPFGATIKADLNEGRQQRDILAKNKSALALVDEVMTRLGTESGMSTTTGVGGALQRGLNATVGQLTGKNMDPYDAETMSKLKAVQPMIQQLISDDKNGLARDQREDLKALLDGWSWSANRETVLQNLKTIREIVSRKSGIAEERLGGGRPPPSTGAPRRLKFDSSGNLIQ